MPQRRLVDILKQLTQAVVYFGPQGFEVAMSKAALKQAQHGYGNDQSTQCHSALQGWQSSWYVIARDTELGDPYFVDLASSELAVYTALPENNVWQAEPVSLSLAGFITCLNLLVESGAQTMAQFVPDESTVIDEAILTPLYQKLVTLSGCESFWLLFFQCYQDWLEDDEE